jgi:hypothetical protein
MKRFCAGLSVLVFAALLIIPAAGWGSELPRSELRDFSCQRALDPINRSVGLTAVMRPLTGTKHMAVKFDLLVSRGPGTPFKPLHAGDLGLWISPDNPTLGQLPGDVWNLEKSVVALHAPNVYRFRVRFRWEGAHKVVLGTDTRYGPRCDEPELRPDLEVRSIAVSAIPGHPNSNLYTAQIANRGSSAAGPFDVLFAPGDGSVTTTKSVTLLRAHHTLNESFTGPVCSSGTAPTITADSADQVDDLNRANNSLTATCPS